VRVEGSRLTWSIIFAVSSGDFISHLSERVHDGPAATFKLLSLLIRHGLLLGAEKSR
jgi:hypothetical protein